MTDARHRGFWHRTGLIGGAGAALLLAAAAQGCSDEGTTTSTTASTGTGGTGGGGGGEGGAGGTGGAGGAGGGAGGMGGAGGSSASIDISPACTGSADSFTTPFDATPDPEGVNVFFTALNANGEGGVFKGSAAGGGACSAIFQGDPLVAPFNIVITSDNKTLFIADSGSDDAAETDGGHVFTLSPMGGSPPAVFTGTEGMRPRGIDVHKDADAETLYFTGTDPATGERGVFRVLSAGGAVSALAKGAAFKDPSGIVVSEKKVAYVCDTTGTESEVATILSIDDAGNVATVVSNIRAGYPCGIALTADEGFLFVSSIDPSTETDVITRIKVDTKDVDYLSQGIDQFTESAGLHRARNADSYAWADSKANGMGTVFTVKLK
jgi:hypothetical protein